MKKKNDDNVYTNYEVEYFMARSVIAPYMYAQT